MLMQLLHQSLAQIFCFDSNGILEKFVGIFLENHSLCKENNEGEFHMLILVFKFMQLLQVY
jgi:hypothetical protein